jgi:hypothetical protein
MIPDFQLAKEFVDLDPIDRPLEIANPIEGKKLEVISYVNGLMMEISYFDLKDGEYFLSPVKESPFDVSFFSIGRQKIFTIRDGHLDFFMSKDLKTSTPWESINLNEGLFLSSGVEQVSFRFVEKTIKCKGVPAFYRDRDFLKVGPKAFLSVFLPLLLLLFITVPEKDEKVSEIAVIYKLPEKQIKVSEAEEASTPRPQSTVQDEGELAQALSTKDVLKRKEASPAASAKPAAASPKAYEFNTSVEVASLVGEAPLINSNGRARRADASDSAFGTGSKESGELVVGADIGVSKFNGSDKKGSGSASYGSRGLAAKTGQRCCRTELVFGPAFSETRFYRHPKLLQTSLQIRNFL